MQPLNQLKQMKQTYRASQGSPRVQLRGKRSRQYLDQLQPKSQPEFQPDQTKPDQPTPSGLEEHEEELRPWVCKPFDVVVDSLRHVKGQYAALEHVLQEISKELKVEPHGALECVKKLSKVQDMEDLQARVDCLLKENGKLKNQVAAKEAQLKEVGALKTAVEEELVQTREDQNKALAISRKFHNLTRHSGNVVNKTRLYDASMDQLRASTDPKVIWCLVDYNTKMEKLLKELRALLQPAEQQQAPKPPSSQLQPRLQLHLSNQKHRLCRAPLLKECPQHHGHKGDPEVTPGTCGAIGERAQVILVWVRAPGLWECLPPTETRNHES